MDNLLNWRGRLCSGNGSGSAVRFWLKMYLDYSIN